MIDMPLQISMGSSDTDSASDSVLRRRRRGADADDVLISSLESGEQIRGKFRSTTGVTFLRLFSDRSTDHTHLHILLHTI